LEKPKAVIVANGGAQGKSRFMTKAVDIRASFNAICAVDLVLTGGKPMAKTLNCRMLIPTSIPVS